MRSEEVNARLGYSNGVASRAKGLMAKSAALIAGTIVLASAFVVSLALFAFAFAALLVLGGYVWWKTRDLRRQLREQLYGQTHMRPPAGAQSSGNVIDGVVLSRTQTRDDSDPRVHSDRK